MQGHRYLHATASAAFCATALLLAACDKPPSPSATIHPAPVAATPAASTSATPAPAPSGSQASAYMPPSAGLLYQMVAPIALFPDNLVAQVLAGAAYPEQIGAANDLLKQHSKLQGNQLQALVDPQPWDNSVKSLSTFPGVIDQMAQNLPWTTALGQAYAHDPADVLNAIQVMRQRAAQQGNLTSNSQQTVVTRAVSLPPGETVATTGCPSPAVVPAPSQIIEVQPTDADLVYVPNYDPGVVYGEDMAVYPGYAYVDAYYPDPDPIMIGAVGFGTGILVGALLDHGGWGWHSWGMNWGGRYDGGWRRPAVIYNHNAYLSHSAAAIDNRYADNGASNHRYGANAAARGGAMSMPDFSHALERNAGADARFGAASSFAAEREAPRGSGQPTAEREAQREPRRTSDNIAANRENGAASMAQRETNRSEEAPRRESQGFDPGPENRYATQTRQEEGRGNAFQSRQAGGYAGARPQMQQPPQTPNRASGGSRERRAR